MALVTALPEEPTCAACLYVLPVVFGPANASVEVVVVPASFPTCCTRVIPAACACTNAPVSSRSGKRTRRRVRRTPIAEEFLRRKLIDIGHPPRIKDRFSLTGMLVSFTDRRHPCPWLLARPFHRQTSVRLEISKPHTTQVGWPGAAQCLALKRLRQPQTSNAVPSVLRTVPVRCGGAIPFPKGYSVNPLKNKELIMKRQALKSGVGTEQEIVCIPFPHKTARHPSRRRRAKQPFLFSPGLKVAGSAHSRGVVGAFCVI